MAKEMVTKLIDDLGGGAASTTVPFSWNGVAYEIDLSAKNAATLAAVLAPYVAAARTTSGRPRKAVVRRGPVKARAAAAPKSGSDLSVIRQWAARNGHTINARGRIASAVLEAFHAAQHAVADVVDEVTPAKAPRKTAKKAAKKAPAKKTVAAKAPAAKAPVKKAPAKKAPAKKASGRRATKVTQADTSSAS